MCRVNTPPLSDRDRLVLEPGFKKGKSHGFRIRCHVILLKSEGRSSRDAGLITGMSHINVNSWVKRFKSGGISGLRNRPGQGRKLVLDSGDRQGLLEAVKNRRQHQQTAKAEWEAGRGKSISDSTLRRFLEVLTEDINGQDAVPKAGLMRNITAVRAR
jgi:transposase